MSAMDALLAARSAWDRQHWQQSFDLETLTEQAGDLDSAARHEVHGDSHVKTVAPCSVSVSQFPVSVGPCPAVVPDAGVSPGMGRNAETGSNLAGSPEHHPCHDASTVPRGGSHDALPASPINNTSHGARARQGIALHGSGGER